MVITRSLIGMNLPPLLVLLFGLKITRGGVHLFAHFSLVGARQERRGDGSSPHVFVRRPAIGATAERLDAAPARPYTPGGKNGITGSRRRVFLAAISRAAVAATDFRRIFLKYLRPVFC